MKASEELDSKPELMKILQPALDKLGGKLDDTGDNDTHAKVVGDAIEAVNKIAGALEGVDDEASAKEAAMTIKGMVSTMTKLKERAVALGEPEEKAGRKLMEKFEPRMEEAMGRTMRAATGLASKPELMKILQPALDKVGGVMPDM